MAIPQDKRDVWNHERESDAAIVYWWIIIMSIMSVFFTTAYKISLILSEHS